MSNVDTHTQKQTGNWHINSVFSKCRTSAIYNQNMWKRKVNESSNKFETQLHRGDRGTNEMQATSPNRNPEKCRMVNNR